MLILPGMRKAVMRLLKRLDGGLRGGSQRCLVFLEDRLAPFTLAVLLVVLVGAPFFWNSWRGEESNGTAIRNLILVIAAIAALPLAIWRSKVAEHQSETAQRGLLNERYQKGAEMLGSKELSVRLGGIYALDSLARENPIGYHIQIMRLLCAFVRNHRVVETQEVKTYYTYRREDVQAAVAAVGSRNTAQVEIEKKQYCLVDFSGADLRHVNFLDAGFYHWDPRSGKFSPANMENAHLYGANLSRASMTAANFKGAYFSHANFKGATLIHTVLAGADLKDCKGLTQEQINMAAVSPDNPPELEGVLDAETGKPIVWRGKAAEEN